MRLARIALTLIAMVILTGCATTSAASEPAIDTNTLERLLQQLQKDDSVFQRSAAEQLGRYKAKQAVAPLIETLKSGRYYEGRAAAAKALGNIGDPRATEALIAALQDESEMVVRNAVRALGQIGATEAEDSLLEMMAGSTRNKKWGTLWISRGQERPMVLGEDIAVALGRIKSRAAVPVLAKALSEPNDALRTEVARALGEIGDPGAADALVDCLNRGDTASRLAAAEALKKLSRPPVELQSRIAYDVLLGDVDHLVASGSAAEPAMIAALASDDARVRQTAAATLLRLGWEPTTTDEALQFAMAGRNWDSLASLGEASIPSLIRALEDHDSDVRSGAARSRGRPLDYWFKVYLLGQI